MSAMVGKALVIDAIATHQTVHGSLGLLFYAEVLLGLCILDRDVDEASVALLLRGGEDERRVGGCVLGIIREPQPPRAVTSKTSSSPVACKHRWLPTLFDLSQRQHDWGSRLHSHSKSPESETTTVPVRLRKSSEVVIVCALRGRWADGRWWW